VATTIEPPSVLPETADYDPYPSPDHGGDVEAARAAMAESRYDANGDGVCDDPVCEDVVLVNASNDPWALYTPILRADLAELGIEVEVRELSEGVAYGTIQKVDNLIPIAAHPGWVKDYASPFGFEYFLFNTVGIACDGAVNYSNVGITREMAAECGADVAAAYDAAVEANGEIPSVDADMDACVATPPGAGYNACWAALDARLMEEIVPIVPYRWGTVVTALADSVVAWTFDQSDAYTAYSRVAVTNGLTMDEVAA
jgi:ABC-type transport system substrate-binding protein